jgi:hypothetical protein
MSAVVEEPVAAPGSPSTLTWFTSARARGDAHTIASTLARGVTDVLEEPAGMWTCALVGAPRSAELSFGRAGAAVSIGTAHGIARMLRMVLRDPDIRLAGAKFKDAFPRSVAALTEAPYGPDGKRLWD